MKLLRPLPPALGLLMAVGLGFFVGCQPPEDDACSPGAQGCECRPPVYSACDPGLVCSAINICIPGSGGSDDDGGMTSDEDPGSPDPSGAGDGSAEGGNQADSSSGGNSSDPGNGSDPGGSGPGGGGSCAQTGQDCTSSTCCDDSTCVDFGSSIECAADCSVGNDCGGCCCVGLQNGGAVCADGFCGGSCAPGCSAIASLCEIQGDCCEFASGSAYCVNFPEVGGLCAASCFTDSDCVSNCCLGLTGGGAACGPAELCGGAAPIPEPGELMGRAAQRVPGAAVPPTRASSSGDEVDDFMLR